MHFWFQIKEYLSLSHHFAIRRIPGRWFQIWQYYIHFQIFTQKYLNEAFLVPINPIQDEGGKKPPLPYQFFPCNLYKGISNFLF